MQVILPLGSKPDKRAGMNPEGNSKDFPPGGKCIEGVTGELLCIRKPPEPEIVRRCTLPLQCVLHCQPGCKRHHKASDDEPSLL